jgi:hypothetical protein
MPSSQQCRTAAHASAHCAGSPAGQSPSAPAVCSDDIHWLKHDAWATNGLDRTVARAELCDAEGPETSGSFVQPLHICTYVFVRLIVVAISKRAAHLCTYTCMNHHRACPLTCARKTSALSFCSSTSSSGGSSSSSAVWLLPSVSALIVTELRPAAVPAGYHAHTMSCKASVAGGGRKTIRMSLY